MRKKLRVFCWCAPISSSLHILLPCFAQLVLTMPVQPDDPRLYIGASVEAKAVFVTSLAECSRRYGTNAKTKVVPGLVVSFGQDSAPSGRTRAIMFVVTDLFWRQCSQTRKAEHSKCQFCWMFCTTWGVEGDSLTTRESNHCHISSSCCSSRYFMSRTAVTASSTSWRQWWQQECK